MTLTVQYSKVGPLPGNGATTNFSFDFPVYDQDHLVVIFTNTGGSNSTWVRGTNYNVTLNSDQTVSPGGSITTLTGSTPATGESVTLYSNTPRTQQVNLPSATNWNPVTVMRALDRLTVLTNQLQEQIDRAILFPVTDFDYGNELPRAATRANKYLQFDSNGAPGLNTAVIPGGVTVSAFSQTVLDDTSAAAWFATLGVDPFALSFLDDTSASAVLTTLGYSAFGQSLTSLANAAALQSLVGISTFGATLVDDATASDALTTLGFSNYAKNTLITLADVTALKNQVASPFVVTLLDDANAGAFMTTLGISAFAQTLLDDADAATARATLGVAGAIYQRGMIGGYQMSNSAGDPVNDITISAGDATDSTFVDNMRLTLAITKQLDAAWAVGNNAGGRDAGAIADAWWHVWAIKRSDTGVVDVLFSLSPSSPTMPTNYDRKRRIGSILRTGGAIKAFVQNGGHFQWTTPPLDVNTTNPGVARVTPTMLVPTGVTVFAAGHGILERGAADTIINVTPLTEADVVPSTTATPLAVASTEAAGDAIAFNWAERTDTSARIAYRLSFSDGTTVVRMTTTGWIDERGRDE